MARRFGDIAPVQLERLIDTDTFAARPLAGSRVAASPLGGPEDAPRICENRARKLLVSYEIQAHGLAMTDVNAVLRRDRAVVIAAITTISVLAWAYTLWLAAQMGMMEMPAPTAGSGSGTMIGINMGGMSAAAEPAFRTWSIADFAFTFIMWAMMMRRGGSAWRLSSRRSGPAIIAEFRRNA
jgi:hypothetical protein